MTDLNVMIREQALAGLQLQLDTAVTNGDTAAARKVTEDIAKLAVSAAPKAPPFGDAEIKAALTTKAPWFGVDPKKSGQVIAFGKDMDPRKFATAEAFADALIKAVEDEFKPAGTAPPENETDEEREDREAAEAEATEAKGKEKPAKRATDAPGDADALGTRTGTGRRSGPWAKLSDAPADVQKEINRTADKYVRSTAPKEEREKFISTALGSHYAIHQRNKGKK